MELLSITLPVYVAVKARITQVKIKIVVCCLLNVGIQMGELAVELC